MLTEIIYIFKIIKFFVKKERKQVLRINISETHLVVNSEDYDAKNCCCSCEHQGYGVVDTYIQMQMLYRKSTN
jgi:hypothetical protein